MISAPGQVARAFGLHYAKLFVGKDDAATLQGCWPSAGAEHVIFNPRANPLIWAALAARDPHRTI